MNCGSLFIWSLSDVIAVGMLVIGGIVCFVAALIEMWKGR